MFIDTHTHLYSDEFTQDRNEIIQQAIVRGVSKFYLPNVDSTSISGMLALEKQYPQHCFPMMGLHPCSVNKTYLQELETVKLWLDKRQFYAIGEIGMDLYWDKTYILEQQIAFKQQIEWALQYNYTIAIHCRNAFDEIFDVLNSFNKLPKIIFHCFSGTFEQATQILNFKNIKLGIGGVVTFKNSGLDKVVEGIDLNHLVLETDSPYLAPIPYRGKRNQSAYIPIIAQKIADIKNTTLQNVMDETSANAIEIFKRN